MSLVDKSTLPFACPSPGLRAAHVSRGAWLRSWSCLPELDRRCCCLFKQVATASSAPPLATRSQCPSTKIPSPRSSTSLHGLSPAPLSHGLIPRSSHCIRGHRSTSCTHNDRPLYYIRKKGRPVSQCTQCRALRKNRSLHTRCDCPSRVQNKGLANSTEYADLPQGMTDDAAKAFLEALNTDQGTVIGCLRGTLTLSGGCRNCNSNRCQCDARATPSIAPASTTSSPAASFASDFPSTFPIPYSPTFSSSMSAQPRSSIYPMPPSQYPAVPQFTGVPEFNVFSPTPQNSLSVPTPPHMSAQIQHFQRRQEYLMASAQRKIQQDLQTVRKRARGSETPPNRPSTISQFRDLYNQRSSLPTNLDSSLHHDAIRRGAEQHVASYPHLRPSDTALYNYVHDLSAMPYAASLSNTLFRHPAIVELQPRRQPLPQSTTESDEKASNGTSDPDPTTLPDSLEESNNSSVTPLTLEATGTGNSVTETEPMRLSTEFSKHDGLEIVNAGASKKNEVVALEDCGMEGFPAFEKMFESWDASDAEWLYSLQTECSKRGAVCECGDSCCCPGCFTHTNNPGDRGMYQAMLAKLGGILEAEAEESEVLGIGKPCLSTTSKSLRSKFQPAS